MTAMTYGDKSQEGVYHVHQYSGLMCLRTPMLDYGASHSYLGRDAEL
jgi:hypothetical protein